MNQDLRDRQPIGETVHRSTHALAATSAPAGDPGDDGDPPDDDDGGSLPSLLPHPHPTARRDDRRRDSVDRMVEGLDGSDLSSMWREGSKLASPKTFSNVGWPPAEGKFMLRKPPRGRSVTARLFLDIYKEHLIMLSQVSYPLTYYIEDDMKALIETFYKEENLKFLPEDIRAPGIIAFANLSNRQLIYIAQLSVRPTSRAKWLEALWSCHRPPKPTSTDSFNDQGIHYNYNTALLNLIHENVDYLNLNGGVRHMPSLDWKQDNDRCGPNGKKLSLWLARVISEMLSGSLSSRLVIHFRSRSLEEENEAQVTPAPNFGKPREPTSAAELISAFRSIYRYYYTFA